MLKLQFMLAHTGALLTVDLVPGKTNRMVLLENDSVRHYYFGVLFTHLMLYFIVHCSEFNRIG